MRSNYIFIFSFLICLLPFKSKAIQREEDLDKTIRSVSLDLRHLQEGLPERMRDYRMERDLFLKEVAQIQERVDELAVVLYSQNRHNIFQMTFCCKQVQQLYKEYNENKYPFDEWKITIESEIERYNKLHEALLEVPPSLLSVKAIENRERSIQICDTLSTEMDRFKEELNMDMSQFDTITKRINEMELYVEECYEYLQRRVFFTGAKDSYLAVLADFKNNARVFYKLAIADPIDFYRVKGENSWHYQLGRILILIIGIFLVAFILSSLVIRKLIPQRKKTDIFKVKQNYYSVSVSLVLLMLGMLYYITNVFYRDFTIHSSTLILEYIALFFVIWTSITLRVDAKKIGSTLMIYLPMIIVNAFLIFFRIVLVPNDVVHFLLPMLVALTLITQFIVLFKYGKEATRTDVFYGWLSLSVTMFCTIISWVAYRFLALQIMMYWMIALTCIQFMISFKKEVGLSNKHRQKYTWFEEMMNRLFVPLMTIFLILLGAFWGAHIFDMTEVLKSLLYYPFIDLPAVVSISAYKLLWLICVGLLTNYLLYILREVVRSIYGENYDKTRVPVFMTILNFVVWSLYIATGMLLLNVNPAGLAVVMGGLSMGLGFAMKDTIENLISGFSLMFGRVRVGDIIECDGIRGKVVDMGYRSTILETLDGSIIPFLNSQLFTKNFKNITKNHGYELAKITVGVAYGTDIEKAKSLIFDILKNVPELPKDKQSAVLLDQFASSSIDLAIVVWPPVKGKGGVLSKIKEAIYTSFNENNITIPFPQQDIYIHTAEPTGESKLPNENE